MVATLFSLGLLIVTAACGLFVYFAWRSPDNWHIDGETKELEFHRWLDVGIYAAVGLLCLMFGLMGLVL